MRSLPFDFAHHLSTLFLAVSLVSLNGCGSGSGMDNTPASPDFSILLSPTSVPVLKGASATIQVSIQPSGGFSGSVTLNTLLPAGITVAPSLPLTLGAGNSQTITITSASTTATGNYSLSLKGNSGSITHSSDVTVSVVVPSFSLDVTPSSLSLSAGSKGSFQVSLEPHYGFSGSAQVQLTGLPGYTTATPGSPFSVTVGTPQTVTVSTSDSTGGGSSTLNFQATSGSLTASGSASLIVQNSSHPPSRSDYVFTGDTPGGAAYDRKHQRVYVSNPLAGTVDVISSTTYKVLRSIPVPSPRGVDITPDDSIVFIGTGTNFLGTGMLEVFALDTDSMAIAARYTGPAFTAKQVFYPESPLNPIATPDDCALIGVNDLVVKWNPATGQSAIVLTNPTTSISTSTPFGNTRYLVATHSADHTRVIISTNTLPSTVWLYDTVKNQFIKQATFPGYAYSVAANPNGTQFAVGWSSEDASTISLLDANLNTTTSIAGGGDLLFSTDGTILYVTGVVGSVPAVSLINASTGQWSGSAPSLAIDVPDQFPSTDYTRPMAIDETGRIFGQNLFGLAIDDATDLRNYNGSELYPSYLFYVAPNSAPVNQSQTTSFETQSFPKYPAVWFGSFPAQDTSISSGYATATAPASSQVGVVNLRFLDADGVQAWLPHSYTYGAQFADGPDIAAPLDGGTTIDLYGYGLGYSAPILGSGSAPATTVTFGNTTGTVSTVTGANGDLSSLWDLKVVAPKMPAGPADLKASYNGSSTPSSAYHAIQVGTYPLDGTPYSIVYDARRSHVYVAVADHVDVFSLLSHTYLSTIQIPTLNGQKLLAGMALSLDGSKLLVANWSDNSVAVVDPDNPSAATAVSVGSSRSNASGAPIGPFQIASISNNLAYILLQTSPQSLKNYSRSRAQRIAANLRSRPAAVSSNQSDVLQLNLSAMTISPMFFGGVGIGGYNLAASPDGAHLCTTSPNNGPTTLFDLTNDTFISGPISENQGADFCAINGGVIVSASQNRLAMPQVNDMGMRTVSVASLRGYEYLDLLAPGEDLLGIGVDNTGSLMYAPWGQEIALFDTHTGEYRERIVLPYPLLELTAGPMAIDQTGTQIFLASQNGLTVAQLDSLPLAIRNVAESGDTWEITGTGFVSGTTISVDGVSINTAFTDANHVVVNGAPALSSAHLIKVANPDGHSYSYDAVYLR